ncbi:hydrogenase maturation protease [Streptomyces sp. NPDC049555]|uniref:hydrogenase maturation protease n=1 Tax=Streptomyces sp. NPDC049555 TaxID=3154930 RepID=UPI0034327FE3
MNARTVVVAGVRLGRGSTVRLRPLRRTDVLDLALTGRTAEVEAVEEDMEGRVHLVVSLHGDAGRDFATGLGHRFFFAPEEVEPYAATGPVGPDAAARPPEDGRRVLVAGIGNLFLADDGFGPEVITALLGRSLPQGVHAADFGIRGMDLAYRLLEGYDAAVLVDAAPRGGSPGTLYLLDVGPDDVGALTDAPGAHGMDPVKVLALARELARQEGLALPRVVVLGCEPLLRMRGDEADVEVGLSPPVRAAVGEAAAWLPSLTEELLRDPRGALTADAARR